MNPVYGRDLDLNLLRVFVVVAEVGSVTAAAERLYLTQPAVSAALRRLAQAVDAPLFVRQGRGLALTARGRRLLAGARPHLSALIDAALVTERFDPRTSDRTVRLGLADSTEPWLLPRLVRVLGRRAPRMTLVILPAQFRNVRELLTSRAAELAVTVADELPAGTLRRSLSHGTFRCVFDPRHARLGRTPTLEAYLSHEHVIVSYSGDLRGVVEDLLGVQRRVRVSIPSFHGVGALLTGSALVATLPDVVARDVRATHRHLKVTGVPAELRLAGAPLELIQRADLVDDPAVSFIAERIAEIARD